LAVLAPALSSPTAMKVGSATSIPLPRLRAYHTEKKFACVGFLSPAKRLPFWPPPDKREIRFINSLKQPCRRARGGRVNSFNTLGPRPGQAGSAPIAAWRAAAAAAEGRE
jgi:hypothetical protein